MFKTLGRQKRGGRSGHGARGLAALALLIGGAAVLTAVAAYAPAQEKQPTQPARTPATRPATAEQGQQGDGREDVRRSQERQDRDRGPGDGPGRGGPGRGWTEPTPEQWEQALAFLNEHSPRRLELYQQAVEQWRREQGLEDPTTRQTEMPRSIRGARARIYERVRLLRIFEERDPELYQFLLNMFKLEDEIIGALMAARQARDIGDQAAEEEALKRARELITRYAEGTLEEREARIRRLREELSREEQRLEQDRSNFEKLVERLQERFERSLPGDRDESRDESRQGQGDGQRRPSGG